MDYYVVNGSQTIRLPRTATEPVVMELIGAYSPGVQWEIVRDRAESVLIIGEGAPIEVTRVEGNRIFVREKK